MHIVFTFVEMIPNLSTAFALAAQKQEIKLEGPLSPPTTMALLRQPRRSSERPPQAPYLEGTSQGCHSFIVMVPDHLHPRLLWSFFAFVEKHNPVEWQSIDILILIVYYENPYTCNIRANSWFRVFYFTVLIAVRVGVYSHAPTVSFCNSIPIH